MTAQQKRAKAAVVAWLRKYPQKPWGGGRIGQYRLSHIHPVAYVVGYAASRCLVVAHPWQNAEPQVREMVRECPLSTMNWFDKGLRAGDWCITAYVSTESSGQQIAIPDPFKP